MFSVNHEDFAHLKVPLKSILFATKNFAEEKIIYTNDIEKRYWGQLLWSGELIEIHAQRWLKKERDDEKEQQFWMEISMLSTLKHKNLISLIGFCDENDEKIIIYRHGTKLSLSNYLSDPMFLTWVRRMEISIGIAQALSYIHYDESRDFSVIHRCINSGTVHLNDDWEPKLSSFDRSIKIKASQRHLSFDTNKVCNTLGYTDPTYLDTESVSHKSDIFSFGIVLFELLCGRKSKVANDINKYLASLALTHYRAKRLHEIIDWDLWNQMDSRSLHIFADTVYDCLNEERSQRPNIDEIVTRLEKALEIQLEHQNTIMHSLKNDSAHLRIPLENILSATNNFADENFITKSEIGNSYKGQLLWSGESIDICAWRFNKDLKNGEQMFWTEISMLSSLKHKNMVSLVGFCDENDEKIITYKFETRLSLSNYLSDPMLLTWVRRLEISVGVAHALTYIHYDEPRDFSVIHRLITSGRVLLNDDWEPKLSSFECSMKINAFQRHHSFHTNKLEGVKGYGDPTYKKTKSVNHKSDMYSFGIVLFELLCGREAVSDDQDNKYLGPVAIFHHREKRLDEIIDWDLWNQMDSQSFNIFANTAYDCLNEERLQRPNIVEIVIRLEKALELQLEHQNAIMPSLKNEFAHLRIPLENILSATNNFAEENVIGKDEIGNSYKGQLLWSDELIKIEARRFYKHSKAGEHMFWMEISMLSTLKHKNIVSLVGFSDENDEKIIIYKFETRLSLSNYLCDPILLTWVRRLEISVGVAHALSYIHYDKPRDFSVIHRLISSGRVLLNDDWEPKLSFLEYSMKINASQRHHSFHTSLLRGVDGYEDPTYEKTKSVNHKSDMYSFGIVLFELLCGREAISDDQDNKYLGPVAIFHHRQKKLDEIIDWNLLNQMDSQSFNIFADTAYDCLNEERSRRPSIEEIVPRLEKALKLQLECVNPVASTPPSVQKTTSWKSGFGLLDLFSVSERFNYTRLKE